MNPVSLPVSAHIASTLPTALGSPSRNFVADQGPVLQRDPRTGVTLPPSDDTELRETFQQFVGEAFFGQLLGAMRKLTDKPAYFHGGRAEEIFQNRLDELMATKLSQSSSQRLVEPMYELFALGRK